MTGPLYDAVSKRLAAGDDARRQQALDQMREFTPDPELERQLAGFDATRASQGRPPNLPTEQVARLTAYRNRKAAAAAFRSAEPEDAA